MSALSRRDLLRLAAAAAAAPLVPRLASAAATSASPLVAGQFLTAAEMTLLDELTEMILPADEHSGGARAAGVAAYIDGRLAEYDASIPDLREAQERWRAGLRAFEDTAAEERLALLTRVAAAEKAPRTAEEKFFVNLKEWTVYGYYTSKIGIHDEIEYKGNTLQTEYAGIDVATLPPLKLGGE